MKFSTFSKRMFLSSTFMKKLFRLPCEYAILIINKDIIYVINRFISNRIKRLRNNNFKRDIVENPTFIDNAKNGLCPIYAAFDGDKMVAIIGMRSNKTHINLVFTKKEYHRKGIATAIFKFLLNDLLNKNPSLMN